MIKGEIILLNKTGLHARPAAKLVQTTKKFRSKISIIKGNQEADAKSVIRILSLGAEQWDKIIIKADGEDEKEAFEVLKTLIGNKFWEE
jgi:phosphocarrier protein HPr